MFHWLEATKSCAINMLSYSFSNSNSWLVRTIISCGFMFSLGLDGNKYFISCKGCNPHISWNGVWPIPTL
jgi:hypothetical protein